MKRTFVRPPRRICCRGNGANRLSPHITWPNISQATLIPINYHYALLCYRFGKNAITVSQLLACLQQNILGRQEYDAGNG